MFSLEYWSHPNLGLIAVKVLSKFEKLSNFFLSPLKYEYLFLIFLSWHLTQNHLCLKYFYKILESTFFKVFFSLEYWSNPKIWIHSFDIFVWTFDTESPMFEKRKKQRIKVKVLFSLEYWSHKNIILIAVKLLSKYVLCSILFIVRDLRHVKTRSAKIGNKAVMFPIKN